MRIPLPSLLLGASAFGLAFALTRRRYSFDGKVVLITGGSRGFGLVLARQLAKEGAAVALMARDEEELRRGASSIGRPDRVLVAPGDVRLPDECARVVAATVERFGRLDVLVNNAGVIVSSPAAHTTEDDFRLLMDVHFWGTLHMTSAALPHLLVSPGARLVTISSIGGRIPVPHLAAYCASKHAQGALSAVLAHELAGRGVKVCTVYPGLMRTGSHVNARFRGDTTKEFGIFSLASGLPGVSMGAERAARMVLRGVRRGQAEIVVPFAVRQIARLAAVAPNSASRVMKAASRVLPDGPELGTPLPSAEPPRGAELPLHPVIRAAIVLGERAAERNNEIRPPATELA
jgi:NAD(P)-dependent dehydrogenase (short-subunit alcohol dehydrogenase family)